MIAWLALLLALVLAGPAWAQIPTDTWIAIKSPTNLVGCGVTAVLYEKHMTAAYVPKTKRFYFNGGDTQKHFIGPGCVDFGSSSYYQGTHSLDLNVRLASPGQVNAGYATESPYCVTGPLPTVRPKRPDFVGFTWASWLDRLVMVPGEFYVGDSANCAGETPNYSSDPQYPWRALLDFDVTARSWAVRSTNHGVLYTGNDYPWHAYADAVTRRIIRFEYNGDLVAEHYDPAADAWTYYRPAGNGLSCAWSHLAVLDRLVYCADREHGRFGAYDLDRQTVALLGALPGDPWCCMSVAKDKGYVFAVPGARRIIYAELRPATQTFRIWAWSPEAPTWVRMDTLPWKTLDGEVLQIGRAHV